MNFVDTELYTVEVVADYNDADYITRIENFSGREVKDFILPLVKKLKTSKKHHNLPLDDPDLYDLSTDGYFFSDEMIEWYHDCFIPYGADSLHTIESIKIYPYVVKEFLFG